MSDQIAPSDHLTSATAVDQDSQMNMEHLPTTMSGFAAAINANALTIPREEETEGSSPPPRVNGIVKWFDDTKGFGFIKPLPEGEDVFVHIRDLKPKHNIHNPTIYTGEYVCFETAPNGRNPNGSERRKAVNVTGIGDGTLLCDHGQIHFRSYTRVGFN